MFIINLNVSLCLHINSSRHDAGKENLCLQNYVLLESVKMHLTDLYMLSNYCQSAVVH